jgi:hypothetical protein
LGVARELQGTLFANTRLQTRLSLAISTVQDAAGSKLGRLYEHAVRLGSASPGTVELLTRSELPATHLPRVPRRLLLAVLSLPRGRAVATVDVTDFMNDRIASFVDASCAPSPSDIAAVLHARGALNVDAADALNGARIRCTTGSLAEVEFDPHEPVILVE